jgi:DNA-binding protein H-NS
MHYLIDFDSRQDKVAELRRHVMDTQALLNEADREMAKQRKHILPVLNMVHVAAHDQKYVQAGTQTDCHIDCFRSHLLTQVDSRDLSEACSLNLNKLQSAIHQLREQYVAEQGKEDDEGDTDEEERFAEMLQSQSKISAKTGSSGAPSKANRKRGPKKRKTPKIKPNGDPNLELLQDVDENPLSVKLMSDILNGYLSDLTASSQGAHLDDFICSKLLKEKPNVLEASAQLEKIINCMTAEEHLGHP